MSGLNPGAGRLAATGRRPDRHGRRLRRRAKWREWIEPRRRKSSKSLNGSVRRSRLRGRRPLFRHDGGPDGRSSGAHARGGSLVQSGQKPSCRARSQRNGRRRHRPSLQRSDRDRGFSEDPIAASKVAVAYAKDNDKLVILGGVVGTTALDANGVKALAALPSLDELRGKIVGLLAGTRDEAGRPRCRRPLASWPASSARIPPRTPRKRQRTTNIQTRN